MNLPLAGYAELCRLTARRYVQVQFPEHGVAFQVQSLTEGERSDYEAQTLTKTGEVNPEKLKDAKRRLVALCLVDPAGRRMIDPGDEAAVDRLRQIDGLVTGRLYDACREHCGFRQGDIEDLVKKSAPTAAADSSTGSPSPSAVGTPAG